MSVLKNVDVLPVSSVVALCYDIIDFVLFTPGTKSKDKTSRRERTRRNNERESEDDEAERIGKTSKHVSCFFFTW